GSGPGRVIALSAIGNPESFHRTLVTRGLEIADRLVHRDHRRLTDQDVANADTAARRTGADWIACTEKDLWNLPAAWRPRVPLLVPRLEVTVEREADLLRFLEARLAGAS
ncbi:MAG: tetraacyldisaccharide 4'-kinase, partial [Candidatus Eisenbacteria bacterium]|nr:tetraacyldisaccharide 4'-kinase [Candidatus Eisenbacteria bacterium]